MSTTTTTKSVETHIVRVGKVEGPNCGNYRFDPEIVEAQGGDRIHSYFTPGAKHENAFWSGFKPVSEIKEDGEMPWLNMTLGDSDPHYMYSSAAYACNKHGMVMMINPRTGQTIELYGKKSLEAPYAITPGDPFPADIEPSVAATSPTTTLPSTSSMNSTTASPLPKSISGGAIVGIAIGAILVLGLVGFAGFFLARRRNRRIEQLPPGIKKGHSQFDGSPQSASIPVSTNTSPCSGTSKAIYHGQDPTTNIRYGIVEELDGQSKHGPQGYIHGQEYGNP